MRKLRPVMGLETIKPLRQGQGIYSPRDADRIRAAGAKSMRKKNPEQSRVGGSSFVSQTNHRIDASCAAGGEKGSEKAHHQHERNGQREDLEIIGRDSPE